MQGGTALDSEKCRGGGERFPVSVSPDSEANRFHGIQVTTALPSVSRPRLNLTLFPSRNKQGKIYGDYFASEPHHETALLGPMGSPRARHLLARLRRRAGVRSGYA